MQDNKTVQLIILLTLTLLGTSVRAQYCKETKISSYTADLNEDQKPEDVSKCIYQNLVNSGQPKGEGFEVKEAKELLETRFVDVKDDGSDKSCTNCAAGGCTKVAPGSPEDEQKVCNLTRNATVPIASDVFQPKRALFRWRCHFIWWWGWGWWSWLWGWGWYFRWACWFW